jgi:hypothetical protein
LKGGNVVVVGVWTPVVDQIPWLRRANSIKKADTSLLPMLFHKNNDEGIACSPQLM